VRIRNAASISSASALLAVGAALALVGTGCGSKSSASTQPSACETAAENAAAARVARTAYNAGKLGSEASLATFFKGVPRSAYLDADGKLKPWSAFSGSRRFDLESWMGHVEGGKSPVGDRMYTARMHVRNAGLADC
jgi:hypothetical protein